MRHSDISAHWWWADGKFGFGPGGGRRRGGRPWWADAMGERPQRAERGGVRYLVLEAIEAQPRHGYEIIQHIEQRARSSYRPSPGVIYPTLQMLEELEHARVVEQDNRKVYEITDAGRADLQQHRDEVSDFYERFEDDSWESYVENFGDIMKRLGRLFKTLKRAGGRGHLTPKTLKKIGEVIDKAVHDIEAAFEEDR